MLVKSSEPYAKKGSLSFKPDFIADNIADIDFTRLSEFGIKVCLVDLDGTVVQRGKYDILEEAVNAIKRSGMKIYIATNRSKGKDLKNLVEDLGAQGAMHPHLFLGKPFRIYFNKGLKNKNLKRREIVMIGDRYIQDVFGANYSGIHSLLVRKLGEPEGLSDKILSAGERIFTDKISRGYIK